MYFATTSISSISRNVRGRDIKFIKFQTETSPSLTALASTNQTIQTSSGTFYQQNNPLSLIKSLFQGYSEIRQVDTIQK